MNPLPLPLPRPSSTPSLQQHAPPPPNAAKGRKNGVGGEETGQGERDEQRGVIGRVRLRSPKTVQSAEGEEGQGKRERIIVVVRSPYQENCPGDAHPSAHKSELESANPAWTPSVHPDARDQRHGQPPISGTADPRVVKLDKSSRGFIDTTKTDSGPQRVRMSSGERPIGTAKGIQPDTEALCQPANPSTAYPSPRSLIFPQTMRSHSCDFIFWTTKNVGTKMTVARGHRAWTRPCLRRGGGVPHLAQDDKSFAV